MPKRARNKLGCRQEETELGGGKGNQAVDMRGQVWEEQKGRCLCASREDTRLRAPEPQEIRLRLEETRQHEWTD